MTTPHTSTAADTLTTHLSALFAHSHWVRFSEGVWGTRLYDEAPLHILLRHAAPGCPLFFAELHHGDRGCLLATPPHLRWPDALSQLRAQLRAMRSLLGKSSPEWLEDAVAALYV